MEIVVLLKSFFGLVAILAVLIFLLLYVSKKKKAEKKGNKAQNITTARENSFVSLESLLKIIQNKRSTTKELASALDLVIKYHGNIHPKLGVRRHPDFDIYGEIILRICHHPHINKDLIIKFDKALEEKNEEYKKDINDYLTKGLNTRGF